MAEYVQSLQEIQQLPENVHLFCPRESEEDDDRYDEDEGDLSQIKDASRRKQVQRAKDRRKKFISTTILLAFDGGDVIPYHDTIYQLLDQNLKRCDVCVRRYHIERMDFLVQLRQDYNEPEIQDFLTILDRRDISRIKEGLINAADKLKALPEIKRGVSSVDHADLIALFEALHCRKFHEDESLLTSYFDEPFRLIQTKKPLRAQEVFPSMTKFLFDSNTGRLSWAVEAWNRLSRSLTGLEWDYAVRDTLQSRIHTCGNPNSSNKLWTAVKVIVRRLDVDGITYKLFDLNPPFGRLALDHLAQKTHSIPAIVLSLRQVCEQAPEAFWQTMQSISSLTMVESIFNSPNFNMWLEESVKKDAPKDSDVLSWVIPFLKSIKAPGRPVACHPLIFQLFQRIRSPALSSEARILCFRVALKAIQFTVCSFSEGDKSRGPSSRLAVSGALDIVSAYLDEILKPNLTIDLETIRDDAMGIVRNSIALEIYCLKDDYNYLTENHPMGHESCSFSPDVWTSVTANLNEDNVHLSRAALIGLMPFTGLDELRSRDRSLLGVKDNVKITLKRDFEKYNSAFKKITERISLIIEKISEFKADHLDALFKEQQVSMVMFGALFSGDDATYQAALAAIKNISGAYGRKEALDHLLQAFLSSSLYAIAWVFRRFVATKSFIHVPRLLKIGRDIMDLLCDTTGILRSQKLDARGINAVENYWSYQWAELRVIFQYTEQWSLEVHDKALMMDVARDTMQYAEDLFDKYDLFLSLLKQGKPNHADDAANTLLNTDPASGAGSPAKVFYNMSQWLRLRDQYLANTLTNLITNMLRRLKGYGTSIPEQNFEYLFAILIDGHMGKKGKVRSIKTLLTAQQKAELTRALELYLNRTIVEHTTVKKQSTLNNWTVSSDRSGSSTPASAVIEIDDDEFEDNGMKDEDLHNLSNRHEAIQRAKKVSSDPLLTKPKQTPLSSSVRPSGLSLQQMRDKALKEKQAASGKAFIERRKQEQAASEARRKEASLRLRSGMGVGEHTSGAGSGLSGIGVKGKDHTVAQGGIMVSSESDSDSDDDDELFGKVQTLARPGGPSLERKPITNRPVRKVKQARSQKDIRARLTPDLSPLHKEILSWDFFADSETPPNSNTTDYTLVTKTFRNAQEYVKTFQPLLILEAWQSFRSAREDSNFKPFEIKVASSLIVDNFFEVNTVVPMAEQKELGLGISDVVLLSRGKRPHEDKDQPHCLARVKNISRKKGDVEIVYRVNSASNPLRSYLNDKSTIYGAQIQSLTPLEREYSALMALEYYDLCDEIIRAKPSPLLDYPESELADIKETYNVNVAQAKAVRSAIDNDAFTLIQGPPGSGKTKTICAIVGAILTGFVKRSGDGQRQQNGRIVPPPASKKILVCAPSNAAVDELVMRFKTGVKLMDGSDEKVNVVRLGRSDAINLAVKDVTLEELVNARLNTAAPKDKDDIHSVMMEHKSISEELNKHRSKMDEQRARGEAVKNEDERVFDGLKRKKTALGAKIDNMREQQNAASRDADLNRKRMQQEILDTAHILCATLSGSGHEIFQGLNVEFETVVIDEAAQSIELSALIPLKYGCNKCILVGDPKQLPPTVLSREAARFQYEQSLFARMEGNHKNDVHLLDTQYRMHPEISLFPSRMFYDSRLKDGNGMAKLRARPWHHSQIFAPYRFFDVQGMSQAATKGHSLVNITEINVAMRIYDRLTTDVPKYNFKGKVGIITPYKGQLKELKNRFRQQYGESILSDIEFNTTDAFQGRESEIIIFSCVRASTSGLGFLNDIRRMNVGLTRAKCSLWVLGNSDALTKGEYWRGLVKDAKSRNLYTDGDIVKLLRRPLLTDDMMKEDVTMEDAKSSSPVEPQKDSRKASRENSSDPTSNVKKDVTASDSVPQTMSFQRPSNKLSRESSSSSLSKHSARNAGTPASGSDNESRSFTQPRPERSTSLSGEEKNSNNRPAGGRFGLDTRETCNTCGSNAHLARYCDNTAAREASIGTCYRCAKGGHTHTSCKEPRCIACGAMGHLEKSCTASPGARLSKTEQDDVKRQEIAHEHAQQRARERRAEKRLGEHGSKVPTVKPSSAHEASGVKRKREEDARYRDEHKSLKSEHSSRSESKPSKEDGELSRTTGNGSVPGNANIRAPGSGPPRPPQVIKRKKARADDIFVKRK